jgi:hypothetical protein
MSRFALWSHIVLCVLGLGLAWQAAHHERERTGGPSSVTLLDVEPAAIASLDYRWDKGTTRVRREGRQLLVEVDRELPPKAPPKSDADGDAAPAVAAEPAREKATIPAGKVVVGAIDAVAPLKTKRTLGVIAADRLGSMGLAEPQRSLTITTARGRTLTLDIGDASYGAQGRYARVRGDDVVHLLEPAIVSGVEGSVDALLEKRPLPAEIDAVRALAVRAGDRAGEWVHVDRDQPAKRRLARRDEPNGKDDAATKLLGTLRGLRGTKLVDDAAKAGDAVATFVVDLGDEGPLTLELVQRGDGSGHVVRAGPWAWELAATPVKELLDDVDAVFAP